MKRLLTLSFTIGSVVVTAAAPACSGRAPGGRDDGIIDVGDDDDGDDDDDDDEPVDCSAFSPVARVLATDDFEVAGVAALADHVYWISRATAGGPNRIMRTPRDGGDVEEVAPAGENPGHFSQGGRFLVFADYVDAGDVVAIDTSLDPPTPITLASNRASPLFTAVDGVNVYFAEGRNIFRATPEDPGTVASVFSDDTGLAQTLTRDEGFLYWVAAGDSVVLSRIPLDAAAGEREVQREALADVAMGSNASNLLVAGSVIFFTDDFGRLLRHDRETGEQIVFGDNAYRIARDDERVYWSDPGNFDGATGSIRSRAIDGSDDEVAHAEGLPLPYAVAVDECAVYWVDLDDSTVRTVAK